MQTLADKKKARIGVDDGGVDGDGGAPRDPGPPDVRTDTTVVGALAESLAALGVEQAFGVSGGAVALFFDALEESPIRLHHFRHESGAAFAAAEAHFASGKPVVVFATSGPGILNALTGLSAARWDGAKVILVTGATSAAQRGRWATQETSSYTLPQDPLYAKGSIFDFAVRMEQAAELPEVLRRLNAGVARSGGYVAHVCLPMSIQSTRIDRVEPRPPARTAVPAVPRQAVATAVRLLRQGSFVVWAGFGATRSASLVRELVERSGAKVLLSPRAKGVISENHPQCLGVTGLGGHPEATDYMVQQKPRWVLVLGTRLGEATSFWDRDLEPSEGFIHVDLDPQVPGTAYPDTRTIGIQAEIGRFLEALLEHFPSQPLPVSPRYRRRAEEALPLGSSTRTPVRPAILMAAVQHHVIDHGDAPILAECGNSFAWCNHYLRFPTPGRYRVSTLFGSMGHMAAGVVGAALARGGKAVAVVGDGSMLMSSEVSTAAQYRAKAVWVVLNDAGYGMCRDGHRALGLTDEEVGFPRVDFVGMARAVGADGMRVEAEDLLDVALEQAMRSEKPFVLDVLVDPDETSPLLARFESLIKQGSSKNVAGWET